MSTGRKAINDDALNQVVGGKMHFNYDEMTLKYIHEETGDVTYYTVDDFEKAWKLSNSMHGNNYHEDDIIAELLSKGYIS